MQGADSLAVSPLPAPVAPWAMLPVAPRPLPRERQLHPWSIDPSDLEADVESLDRWLDLNA